MALNSIEKLEIMKHVVDTPKFNKMCDEIIEDIKMKIIVLDDYASEIRALKKQLEELCE